jgi:hypothetical protein
MPTINPKLQGKNGAVQTVEAITNILLGGQLVVPSGTTGASGLQTVVAAGANAINCIGVAQSDAVPVSLQAANVTGTSAWDAGYPAIDTSVPDATVAVYQDCVAPITYGAGAVAFGAKLKCGATGTVVAHVSGTDAPERCIGSCAQPGGTAGGVIALVRLYPL